VTLKPPLTGGFYCINT